MRLYYSQANNSDRLYGTQARVTGAVTTITTGLAVFALEASENGPCLRFLSLLPKEKKSSTIVGVTVKR